MCMLYCTVYIEEGEKDLLYYSVLWRTFCELAECCSERRANSQLQLSNLYCTIHTGAHSLQITHRGIVWLIHIAWDPLCSWHHHQQKLNWALSCMLCSVQSLYRGGGGGGGSYKMATTHKQMLNIGASDNAQTNVKHRSK